MIATKTVTLVSTQPQGEIVSAFPIRSISISNLAAHNVSAIFSAESGSGISDAFVIPPSTALELDVWDLVDENITNVVFLGTSGDSISVIYKATKDTILNKLARAIIGAFRGK